MERLHLGQGTNNEAEYWTLQAALRAATRYLESKGVSALETDVVVRGDSRLVLEQLRGTWKAKDPRMRQLRDETRKLMQAFGKVLLVHQPREQSVAVLGH
jgi:ribonuclease HI